MTTHHRNTVFAAALAATVLVTAALPVRAADPDQAQALVKFAPTLQTGRASLRITYYTAPVGKAKPGDVWQTFVGTLVFQRPDNLRVTLTDVQGKALSDSAASGGKLSWRDAATGKSGSGATADYVEVAARVLLSDKDALSRDFVLKELPRIKGAPYAVQMTPRLFGSNLVSATVWTDGQTINAMEFHARDRSRIFFAVTAFEPNAVVKASEFVIK